MILPGAARARVEVELEVGVRAAELLNAARADGARGARPRFVCTMTPVALSTRRSDGADRRSSSPRAERRRRRGRRRPRSSSRARSSAGARLRSRASAARPQEPRRPAAGRPTGGREAPCSQSRFGTTSRSNATRSAAARRPDLEDMLVVDRLGRTPAAALVTHENARQRIPMCRAASTSGTVDIPTRSARARASSGSRPASRSRAEPGRITPSPSESPSRAAASWASSGTPGRRRRTCRGSAAQRLVVGADERGGALEVQVVGDVDEPAGLDRGVDRAAGVRQHEAPDAEPAENAHAEDDGGRRMPLVEMRATFHHGDGTSPNRPRTSAPACPRRWRRASRGCLRRGSRPRRRRRRRSRRARCRGRPRPSGAARNGPRSRRPPRRAPRSGRALLGARVDHRDDPLDGLRRVVGHVQQIEVGR